MKIEVLGDGCVRCKALKRLVQQAVDELGCDTAVNSVTDPGRIADLAALSLPLLVIDGKVMPPGDINSLEKIKKHVSSADREKPPSRTSSG